LEAAPEQFADLRTAISRCENNGTPIAPDLLEKLAKAFDVPVYFLDPQGKSTVKRPFGVSCEPLSEAQAQHAAEQLLPVAVRKLLEQIRTTAALGMLSDADGAWLLKEMSRRLWKKELPVAA
jgi:transcriptional regulator with XRE-family HTH domain